MKFVLRPFVPLSGLVATPTNRSKLAAPNISIPNTELVRPRVRMMGGTPITGLVGPMNG